MYLQNVYLKIQSCIKYETIIRQKYFQRNS